MHTYCVLASISPKDASMLIPVYLHSKLRYKFAATTFTKLECDTLDKIFRRTIINKMGYSRRTNLCIIHASYQYGGLKIPTSWDLQGSLHVHLLLGHLQLGDLVGKHLIICISYLYRNECLSLLAVR